MYVNDNLVILYETPSNLHVHEDEKSPSMC